MERGKDENMQFLLFFIHLPEVIFKLCEKQQNQVINFKCSELIQAGLEYPTDSVKCKLLSNCKVLHPIYWCIRSGVGVQAERYPQTTTERSRQPRGRDS